MPCAEQQGVTHVQFQDVSKDRGGPGRIRRHGSGLLGRGRKRSAGCNGIAGRNRRSPGHDCADRNQQTGSDCSARSRG